MRKIGDEKVGGVVVVVGEGVGVVVVGEGVVVVVRGGQSKKDVPRKPVLFQQQRAMQRGWRAS